MKRRNFIALLTASPLALFLKPKKRKTLWLKNGIKMEFVDYPDEGGTWVGRESLNKKFTVDMYYDAYNKLKGKA